MSGGRNAFDATREARNARPHERLRPDRSLRSQAQKNEDDIRGLSPRIDTLENDVDAVEADVAAVEAGLAAHKAATPGHPVDTTEFTGSIAAGGAATITGTPEHCFFPAIEADAAGVQLYMRATIGAGFVPTFRMVNTTGGTRNYRVAFKHLS